MDSHYRLLRCTWGECEAECAAIRRQVFIVEQAVPEEEEWDGLDSGAIHFVIYQQQTQQAVACARLLIRAASANTASWRPKLTRMAVLLDHRRQGLGRALVSAAIAETSKHGYRSLELDAQRQAQAFYSIAGFRAVGKPFLDAGIEHIKMIKELAVNHGQ